MDRQSSVWLFFVCLYQCRLSADGVSPESPTAAASVGEQTLGVAKLRAFLVEDSPIVVETLSAALEEMAEIDIVGCASTEEAALFWFGSRSDGCDVAIIDIFLQSGSGLGVLEGMKKFAPPPQRVVLTNYPTGDMRSRCKALGAEEVFDKSTELEELVLWFHRRQSTGH
jgi:DNA-binding NarL/FixJ family response regulator